MILNLYYSLCGFAEAEVSGGLPERFINACTRGGVFIWNVKKHNGALRFSVSGNAADRLSEIAESCGCTVKILRYRGFRYFVLGFKKRYALMLGFLIFAALVFFAGSLIWKIDISGCRQTNKADIIKILNGSNIKKWSPKRSVDTKRLSKRIVSGVRGVSWAGAELRGTVLKIKIKERREIPDMLNADEPCDIVAARDGVITEMRVRNGEKMKNIGSKVTAGEIIVSALVEKDGENVLPEPYTVHSFGEVIAKTWYEFDMIQPLFEEKVSYSGAKTTRNRIKISKFPINLYFRGSILYTEYDKIIKSRGKYLKLESETLFEKKTERYVMSESEAVEKAVFEASKKLPDNILSAKAVGSDYSVQGDNITVHVIFECTENIAVQQRYTERREEINDTDNPGNG